MPILVRPVREQIEHDRVIRQLQDKWRRKYRADINPGDERTAVVQSGTVQFYPDLVLTTEGQKKPSAVVEVETGESVNHLEAMSQWATFAKSRIPFYLFVPAGSLDSARRLVADHQIELTELWTYFVIGEQIRFTPVIRSAASAADAVVERPTAERRTEKRAERTAAVEKVASEKGSDKGSEKGGEKGNEKAAAKAADLPAATASVERPAERPAEKAVEKVAAEPAAASVPEPSKAKRAGKREDAPVSERPASRPQRTERAAAPPAPKARRAGAAGRAAAPPPRRKATAGKRAPTPKRARPAAKRAVAAKRPARGVAKRATAGVRRPAKTSRPAAKRAQKRR